MTVSIDTFGANFIHYMGGVIATLNDEVRAKKLTKGTVKNWEGSKLVKHVHVQRSNAIAFTTDGGAIPPSDQQDYVESEAYRKFVYGSVGITDGQLNNAKTSKHAAIKVVDSELRGMITGIKNFLNYFWTRDGTGVVTLVGATASGATFTVDDARGIWDGASYSILDATTPTTVHDTFTVTSVARSYDNTLYSATVTPTATLAASGQAADDYIVWGTGQYRSYGRAITGLSAGIDDAASSFQGINAATYTRYTSPVLDNSGTRRDLTPGLIRRMLSMLTQESGKIANDMFVLGNVWLLEKFDEMYESAVRITPDTTTVGQSTPSFQSSMGKVAIEPDKDSPYGILFFVCPKEITYAVQKELHWRPQGDKNGSVFARDDGAGRYTATCMEQAELFYEQRNRSGRIEDLNETVGTAF
jgi:hypothetical protein